MGEGLGEGRLSLSRFAEVTNLIEDLPMRARWADALQRRSNTFRMSDL